MTEPALHKSFRPTRKWWAALISVSSIFIVNWIQAGSFSKELAITLVGIVAQALTSYLVPNENTPGGVPLRKS